MITKYDERVCSNEYDEECKKACLIAMKYIREHFMNYAKKGDLGYSNKFKPYDIMEAFDKIISKYGFEIDSRSLRHAYGIGNNNEWDIVDSKNLTPIGEFYATNNMYNGVYLGVHIKDKKIDSFEICSGGFIRED